MLHGISVEPETVSIDVTSTGCTEAGDFRFLVKTKGASRTEVTVIRIEGDPCDALPHVVTLQFPRKEIGLDAVRAFVVTSPFGALIM